MGHPQLEHGLKATSATHPDHLPQPFKANAAYVDLDYDRVSAPIAAYMII